MGRRSGYFSKGGRRGAQKTRTSKKLTKLQGRRWHTGEEGKSTKKVVNDRRTQDILARKKGRVQEGDREIRGGGGGGGGVTKGE